MDVLRNIQCSSVLTPQLHTNRNIYRERESAKQKPLVLFVHKVCSVQEEPSTNGERAGGGGAGKVVGMARVMVAHGVLMNTKVQPEHSKNVALLRITSVAGFYHMGLACGGVVKTFAEPRN